MSVSVHPSVIVSLVLARAHQKKGRKSAWVGEVSLAFERIVLVLASLFIGWTKRTRPTKREIKRPGHPNASEERRLPVPQARNHDQRSWVFFLVSPRECLPVAGLKPTLQRPVQTLPRDQDQPIPSYPPPRRLSSILSFS